MTAAFNHQQVIEQERAFAKFIQSAMTQDLAHDLAHVQRVVQSAKHLCQSEGGIAEVVVPAAWLHDCFSYPKDHPLRRQSSTIAAEKACEFLATINYPVQYLDAIHHGIAAHSYSAGIAPQTLEAKIVQDADRLDALGAVGIARCIQVSSKLERPLYSIDDPFCEQREPDDSQYTLDHFYRKLLRLSETMQTDSAKCEAQKRTDFMRQFLVQLQTEIGSKP